MQLELNNIRKSYGKQVIFDHLNFNFANSGFYLLSGKSGSGKTTLLNMIAGYEDFDSGERCISDAMMACIFQSYELIQELTVLENIKMAVDLYSKEFDETLLIKLGLKELENYYPNELSGGQKQRVGIARALYLNPNIIICDEPTESLDIDNKVLVLDLLKELSKDKVVIVACHELNYVEKYCDYHYEIQGKKLICLKFKNEKQSIGNTDEKNGYNRSKLKHYIHLMIHRRTLKAVICFSTLLILQIGLYALDLRLFTPKSTLDAINGNVVYVNLYDEDPAILNGTDITAKPIINFKPLIINGKRYKINIYPLENENYHLDDNEIIINEQLLELFSEETQSSIIGKELILSYEVKSMEYEVPMVIKEVVSENDAYYAQLYYDESYFLEELQQDGVYEYFSENSSFYEIITKNDKVAQLYNALLNKTSIRVSHSVLDMRAQNESQMSLYHILFMTVEIIAMVTNIFAILYFNKKDSDYNKTGLSLIYSLGIPMKDIKYEYFKQKTNYMLISSIIIFIVLFILFKLIFKLTINLMLCYIALSTCIYIFSLIYQVILFRNKDISMILKDNKD